jgi:phosphoribosylformylglycinamidine synthase
MRTAVITFPASNCDRDVAVALEKVTGRRPAMIWHQETALPDLDLIVLPGGFSFGDYLRPGAMAAHSPIMREVARRAEAGVLVLGICNGFQILTEARLLPGALLPNAMLSFVCKDVFLRVESAESPFTRAYRPGQVVRFPIAHHEGNYFTDAETLARLEGEGQVAFRYAAPDGAVTAQANPNGSAHNIAGLFNRRRNVLGLMPHPERLADPLLGGTDGRAFFESLVREMA